MLFFMFQNITVTQWIPVTSLALYRWLRNHKIRAFLLCHKKHWPMPFISLTLAWLTFHIKILYSLGWLEEVLKANFTLMTMQYKSFWVGLFGPEMWSYAWRAPLRSWQPVHVYLVTYSQAFLEKQAWFRRRRCHTSLFNRVKGVMISVLTLVTQCFRWEKRIQTNSP